MWSSFTANVAKYNKIINGVSMLNHTSYAQFAFSNFNFSPFYVTFMRLLFLILLIRFFRIALENVILVAISKAGNRC